METTIVAVAAILTGITLILVIWLLTVLREARREANVQNTALETLHTQVDQLRLAQDMHSEHLQQSLQSNQVNVTSGLQTHQQILNNLYNRLGEIQGTSQHMHQVGMDVRRLQNILTSPKLRGQMGEWSLENMLSNVLPQDSYQLQHTFKDGKIVDALVRLREYTVSVDAKFPLPSFQKILQANNKAERRKARRQFLKDVTIHVDKIASAYIRPVEGTLDFALMYIPAENVYYETIIKYDSDNNHLIEHCLEQKVIPVSPNLLYAYLMTVAMGLHGLHIEQQAAEISQNLKKLHADLHTFGTSWDTLGAHLRNAQGKYEEAQKHLDRFTLQLEQVTAPPTKPS